MSTELTPIDDHTYHAVTDFGDFTVAMRHDYTCWMCRELVEELDFSEMTDKDGEVFDSYSSSVPSSGCGVTVKPDLFGLYRV